MTRRPPSRLRLLSIANAVLLVAALSSIASAEPTAAEKETARTLLTQGHELLAKNDARGALEAYRAAHAIMNVPTTGIALANAQAALGLLVDARDTALAVTRMPAVAGESPAFGSARERASTLAQTLALRIPAVRIEISPRGVTPVAVEVDGAPVPLAAIGKAYKVDPGDRVVTARARGFAPASRKVSVAESAEVHVELTLARDPNAIAPELPPTTTARAPSTDAAAADTGTGGTRLAAYALLGLGGAGVVTAGVTGGLVLARRADRDDHCDAQKRCDADGLGAADAARTLSVVNTVALGVGLAAAGVGLALFVVGSNDSSERAALAPTAAPGGGGLALGGRFR